MRHAGQPRTLLQFHPLAYLGERGRQLGRRLTLRDIPDSFLDWIRARGFEAVWLVGIWDRGRDGRDRILADLGRMEALRHHVPRLDSAEVLGQPFTVRRYEVPRGLGGPAALADLRRRMNERGLSLVLDFVTNHTSRDCPWLDTHPQAFVHGVRGEAPEEDTFLHRPIGGDRAHLLAYGRDPYFPGWEDTAQLDARSPAARQLLSEAIAQVAGQCDGIHCNMAMLSLEGIFEQTWSSDKGPWRRPEGAASGELWGALIPAALQANPGIWLIAESYWGQEYRLQALGFHHAWDKLLYDRLRDGDAPSVRAHLGAALSFQSRSVRFLENHFQDRAAVAFAPLRHRAALAITLASPGVCMLSYGQLLGARVRQPLEVRREPQDQPNPALPLHYESLCRALHHPAVREGHWRLMDGDMPHQDGDITALFCLSWSHPGYGTVLTLVNFGEIHLTPRIRIDLPQEIHGRVRLADRLGGWSLDVDAAELRGAGVLVDIDAWGVHVLEVLPLG